MLPLSPPPGYFKEINSIISKFIWNDKCPRIKLTTLQHPNSAGGLAVPNFELYYWSFQLKALHNWVDPQSTVSWRVIEADKVKPNRLQDILFTGSWSALPDCNRVQCEHSDPLTWALKKYTPHTHHRRRMCEPGVTSLCPVCSFLALHLGALHSD